MLVLSRKKNESVVINDNITIVIVEVRGDKVRLGIEAPKEVSVYRKEVYDSICHSQQNFEGEIVIELSKDSLVDFPKTKEPVSSSPVLLPKNPAQETPSQNDPVQNGTSDSVADSSESTGKVVVSSTMNDSSKKKTNTETVQASQPQASPTRAVKSPPKRKTTQSSSGSKKEKASPKKTTSGKMIRPKKTKTPKKPIQNVEVISLPPQELPVPQEPEATSDLFPDSFTTEIALTEKIGNELEQV